MKGHQENILRHKIKIDYQDVLRRSLNYDLHNQQNLTQQAEGSFQSSQQLSSSPSFFTDECNDFANQYTQQFNQASKESYISSFGSQFIVFTEQSRQLYRREYDQLQQEIKQLNKSSLCESYTPSLKSYGDLGYSSIKDLAIQSQHNFETSQSQRYSQQLFVPQLKSLTGHIDFLQNQLYSYQKEYLKMKTVNQAIIYAIKTAFSEEVGYQLERYMQDNINLSSRNVFQNKQNCQIQRLQSEQSQEFLNKMNQKSVEFSKQLDSKQLSKKFKDIFTLGGNKPSPKITTNPTFSQQIRKSTQKKNKNFKKNKQYKENLIYFVEQISRPQHPKKSKNLKQSQQSNRPIPSPSNKSPKNAGLGNSSNHGSVIGIKESERCRQSQRRSVPFRDNQSMRYIVRQSKDDGLSDRSKDFNVKHGVVGTKTHSVVATELLCEVCGLSFHPNQFFKHIKKCEATDSSKQSRSQSLQYETQKLAFNYTLMMGNLFSIRSEIQEQIQLLTLSKQMQKQKNNRENLKQKLEQDLQKVSKIIQKKQKQMQIHLSKNLQWDRLKQSLKHFDKFKGSDITFSSVDKRQIKQKQALTDRNLNFNYDTPSSSLKSSKKAKLRSFINQS